MFPSPRPVSVTCPACHTAQDVAPGVPTDCLGCAAEIDVMPGRYMRVRPAAVATAAALAQAGSGTLSGRTAAPTGQRSSSEQRSSAGSSTRRR